MRNKVGLVTGASGGIGFFTALGLVERGFEVIITGRDQGRGNRARDELRRRAGHERVHFVRVDHESLEQNRALGHFVADRWPVLDVLVNNAGGLACADAKGPSFDVGLLGAYEPNLVLNFLGPYAVTDALLGCLSESGDGRVVNVTSGAHALWNGDPFTTEPLLASPGPAHARAKLLNLLWTFALARRLWASGIVVNATNPGMAWTAGAARLTSDLAPSKNALSGVRRWLLRRAKPQHAARSSILLATDPRFRTVSGAYVGSHGRSLRPSELASDVRHQEYALSFGLRLVACAAVPRRERDGVSHWAAG